MEHEVLTLCISAGLGMFEGLLHEFGPVVDSGGHVADVDEVERLLESPRLFCVVYFELDVVGHPCGSLAGLGLHCTLESARGFRVVAYHEGCVGLKSVPITAASGNSSPTSMAQMPVPVPMSRILSGFSIGAKKSLSDIMTLIIWWVRSRRSSSFYVTFGE